MQNQFLGSVNDNQAQTQHANAIDYYVGFRIRERRVMLGLSQQQLADRIGVTCQQTYKYERGLSRISAGRLFTIAQVMDVSPSWFFNDMQQDKTRKPAPHRRMILELTRNFSLIENEVHQEALSQLARSLARNVRPT